MTSRPIMVDAVLEGVLTTRLASRCGISTPKVGTATQLSNPSDLFAWLDRFHNAPDQLSQDQRCNKKRSRLNGYFAAVEAQELYEEGRRGIGTWAIGSGDRGVVIVLGWSSRLDAGARARGLMAT